jgi:hypothetical protein
MRISSCHPTPLQIEAGFVPDERKNAITVLVNDASTASSWMSKT